MYTKRIGRHLKGEFAGKCKRNTIWISRRLFGRIEKENSKKVIISQLK